MPSVALAGMLAAAAVAAGAVAGSYEYQRRQHADSLVPVLVSLLKWEPYYWGADRNGMLVPLVAVPVRPPFGNLLVQSGLTAFGGLAAVVLVGRAVGRPGGWWAAAAGGVGFVFAVPPPDVRFHLLSISQVYAVSVGLGAAGVAVAAGPGRWRPAAAAGLFALGSWVNLALVVTFGPWLVARWVLGDGRPAGGLARTLGPLAVGFAVGLAVPRLVTESRETTYGRLPVGDWASGVATLAGRLRQVIPRLGPAGGAAVGLAAVWAAVPATRADGKAALRELAAGGFALAVAVAFFGTSRFAVEKNEADPRYLYGVVLVLSAVAANAAVGPPAARLPPRARRWAAVVAAVAVPGMAVGGYGWPSVGGARAGIEAATGHWEADVRAAACTHLAGDYWDVWKAVFHANMARYDRGEPGAVWGVAVRAGPTIPLWAADAPAARVGWLVTPGTRAPAAELERVWRPWFPDHRLVDRRPTLWVYAPP